MAKLKMFPELSLLKTEDMIALKSDGCTERYYVLRNRVPIGFFKRFRKDKWYYCHENRARIFCSFSDLLRAVKNGN